MRSNPRGDAGEERADDAAALEANDPRLERALSAPTVGVLFFSLNGRIHGANRTFEQMSGYTSDELRKIEHWETLTVPEFWEVTAETAHALATRGEAPPYGKQMIRKDGRRWWGMFAPTILSGHGRDAECMEFIIDITARKEVEEELRASEARFRELAEKYRVANERLVETARRKDEFLAMLSHELRNPLAPIKNSLHILDRVPPGGAQARRAHEVIGRQVTHMNRLIDDLLDVTRISRGKIRLQREPLDLCELVHQTAEDHRSLFEARRVHLDMRTCGAPLVVDGDRTRLAQVIGNLLSNAAKFTPPGGHVELRLDRDRADAVLHVRDDGAGIAPDLLHELFQPFVQAQSTLDRNTGGLGLGLSLVKGLVELHGGAVSAHSDGLGRGAEVIVRLPIERDR